MPEHGFNLKIPLPCFHTIAEHIEANVAHITLQPVTRFPKSALFSGIAQFCQGRSANFTLKACL